MRKFRLAVLLACVLLLSLALFGCGGGSKEEAKNAFVGDWELYSIEADSGGTSASDVALMKDLGLSVTLVFNSDDTCTLDLFGDSTTCNWSAKSTSSATISMEDQDIDASIDDEGKLRLSQAGNEQLVFQRADASASGSDASGTGSDGSSDIINASDSGSDAA